MALEANARKTEHNGAKNSSHDKPAKRADLKRASKKLRRVNDGILIADAVYRADRDHAERYMESYPVLRGF